MATAFDPNEPIYRQIADRIRRDIVSGAIEEDQQVMSTNQFAATYRINPATAAKAFGELMDEGVLYRKRGLGMFVSPGARERLLAERRRRFWDEVLEPALAEARLIGIAPDDIAAHIRESAGPRSGEPLPVAPEEAR